VGCTACNVQESKGAVEIMCNLPVTRPGQRWGRGSLPQSKGHVAMPPTIMHMFQHPNLDNTMPDSR
jgi:hypothetical protein